MRIVKIPELDTLEVITNSPNKKPTEWFDILTNEKYQLIQGIPHYVYPCRTKPINGKNYFRVLYVQDGVDLDRVDREFTQCIKNMLL